MNKRSQFLILLILAITMVFLAACRAEPEVTPTGTPSPTPTPTRQPAPQRDPAETPIPDLAAESALTAIRQQGELRVGVLYNYPPIAYLADNGQIQGYEVDLLRRVAERWEVDISFIQVTRQTRLPMLYAGEIDVIAGAMPHRRELEQFVEFTESVYRSGYTVLVMSDAGLNEIAAIGSRRVGVVGEGALEAFDEYAGTLGITPAIQTFETTAEASSALVDGSIQAVVGRREAIMSAASATDGTQIIDEFVLIEPYAFAVRRGDTPLRDLLDLTLDDIVADGTFGELYTHYFYGFSPDSFSVMRGEPSYTFATFPAEIPAGERVVDRIRRGESLRVAGLQLAEESPAFDGQPIVDGLNRALLNEIARRWNIAITEIPNSAGDTGLNLLQSGQADLVVGVRPDVSYIGEVVFSVPYYQRGLRLVHMDDVAVLGVGDLEFKPSLAVPPLDVSQDIIDDNNGFPDVKTTESYEDAFKSLIARGVYAVVGDEFALVLMSQADTRIEVYETRYRPVDYVMALPAYDPDFITLLNFTLQDMYADGTLDLLLEQYFGPYIPDEEELESLQMEIWPGDGGFLEIGSYAPSSP